MFDFSVDLEVILEGRFRTIMPGKVWPLEMSGESLDFFSFFQLFEVEQINKSMNQCLYCKTNHMFKFNFLSNICIR